MNGLKIDKLIRSDRKTISISVDENGLLIVRAPMLAGMPVINGFVQEKSSWIRMRRDLAEKKMALYPPHFFCEGEVFYYMGRELRLHFSAAAKRVCLSDDTLILPALDPNKAKVLAERWYRTRAREFFCQRAEALSARLGVSCSSIRLSSAKTRWGSCSSQNCISLCWRLIMAPPEVLDYVILHELCHIPEKNHRRSFWRLVESVDPDWKRKRLWLRDNGVGLNL